mmetsp:Transcript_41051/g.36222  ORF Transcript_41051/g.36222 Transcript_41051/m.36222 type:complete len:454 (+) Transcript_41051:26-1387(+)
MLLQQKEEPIALQFSNNAAILPASNGGNNDSKISKRKVKNIVNKRKKNKNSSNYNPLLPESTQLDDDEINIKISSKPTQKISHNGIFTLTTNTSKTIETEPSKFYNIYVFLVISNVFLIGSFLLFVHNYVVDAIGILMIIVGFALNLYTIWTFCGQRLCPRLFKHENQLVFDDKEKKIFIHWNGLIKASTIRYLEFARLYIEETPQTHQAIVYIATTASHYRFNKYLSKIEDAKIFVQQVNNWWNVDRLEQKQRQYNNYTVISKHKHEKAKQQQEVERVKSAEEIYSENEEELGKLIKKLKYKSFGEKDIEMACKLKDFFESKYRAKMVEEYENIKKDLMKKKENMGNKNMDESQLIFSNEGKYIASALLLKFETLEKLIQERKQHKLQMMINENKRNKIRFDDIEEDQDEDEDESDDDDEEQDKDGNGNKNQEEEKFDTLEDEEQANGGNDD